MMSFILNVKGSNWYCQGTLLKNTHRQGENSDKCCDP